MASSKKKQQKQEAFSSTEIIYLEISGETKGKIVIDEFLQKECPGEADFNAIVEKIIKKNGLPKARKPRFNPDSRRNPNADNSVLCNACDTEVIFYIPKKMGSFDPNVDPFANYDQAVIGNPRLYYMKGGILQKVSTFSGNDDVPCQLAAFSYKGRVAAQERGTPYAYHFDIQASGRRAFPGSGDIGHPGGND